MTSTTEREREARRSGKRLRAILAAYGKTQSDLATLIGTRSRASEYLTGKRPLTLGNITKIHKAWNVSADELMGFARINDERALKAPHHG